MERKTKVTAEDGQLDLLITREFDLPVELLFRAHAEPEIFEEWMSHEYGKTKVVQFEPKANGFYLFNTTDAQGNVAFQANGTFHAFSEQRIIRTFEMNNSTFGVQLEFIEFEKLTEDTSRLVMQSIFRTGALRDQLLKLPFQYGLNMAHDRLQNLVSKLK